MIFAPSPQILLHKNKPNFKLYYPDIYDEEDFLIALKRSVIINSDLLIDRCILTSRNSEFSKYFSHYNSILAVIISLLSPNSDLNSHSIFKKSYLPIFLAMFALQCKDIKTALHFLEKSSQDGNEFAMLLYAKLLLINRKKKNKDFNKKLALMFIKHAAYYGSVDAIALLGQYYRLIGKPALSLHMLSLHFENTRSLLTATQITGQLIRLTQARSSQKWIIYCIMNGDMTYLNNLLSQFSNSKIMQTKLYALYSKIISKHSSLNHCKREIDIRDQLFNSTITCPDTNFDFHKDFYKLTNVITHKFHSLCSSPFLVYNSSIENEFKPNYLTSNSEINKPIQKEGYYPIRNKNKYILSIFELTTSNYHKRNLKLAQFYLLNCSDINDSIKFTENQIFRCRLKSKNPEWLTSCGFIYLILGEIGQALPLFLKASKLGNFCATMMYGFLLFHFKQDNEQMKQDSLLFLLKCTADPIALIHIYLIMNDVSFLERACSILGTQTKMQAIIWLLNVLSDGVKMPLLDNMKHVKMICLKAIGMGLNSNENTSELYDFYINHFH